MDGQIQILLGDILTAGAFAFVLLVGGGDLAAPLWLAYVVVVRGMLFAGPAFVLGLFAIYLWSRLLPRAVRWSARP
jgi:hypothetical protein